MNFTVVPTLCRSALLKLAIAICSDPEIKHLIKHDKIKMNKPGLLIINGKIATFNLPKILHNAVLALIKPIMFEIISWTLYISHIHAEVSRLTRNICSCLDAIDLQANVQWRNEGLIDRYQTCMVLIQDERLDTAFRFVLACNFCSETDIVLLWQKLPKDIRKILTRFHFLPVVKYWIIRLKKAAEVNYSYIPHEFPATYRFDTSLSYKEAVFEFYKKLPTELRGYIFGTYGRSASPLRRWLRREDRTVTVGLVNVDNVAAMKYFLQSLEPIKGQKLLEAATRNLFISNDLLRLCLSRMNEDQITVVLRTLSNARVLSCFLNLTFVEIFRDFANHIWNSLSAEDFSQLLSYIVMFKISKDWQDLDYIDEVKELYNKSPYAFKYHFHVHYSKEKAILRSAVAKWVERNKNAICC